MTESKDRAALRALADDYEDLLKQHGKPHRWGMITVQAAREILATRDPLAGMTEAMQLIKHTASPGIEQLADDTRARCTQYALIVAFIRGVSTGALHKAGALSCADVAKLAEELQRMQPAMRAALKPKEPGK